MKRSPTPLAVSLLPFSESTYDSSLVYGVDWSDQAQQASHCWLPCLSKNSAMSSDIECATCALTMEISDFDESFPETKENNDQTIPQCRPSFIDAKTTENTDEYDQHFWSNTSQLRRRCLLCKRKSLSNPYQNLCNRVSHKSEVDNEIVNDKTMSQSNALCSRRSASKSLDNMTCLWCSRAYHRQCWQTAPESIKSDKCDYGRFRNIIVRPQWLRRAHDSPTGFRAVLTEASNINDTSLTPVIFFINRNSGGRKGEYMYRKLLRILNPRQVFLVENRENIIQALSIYSSLVNVRICACGGDGTIGWVLGCLIDVFPSLGNPPVGIFPLGTGNDLSRVLNWGDCYHPKRLAKALIELSRAQTLVFDRWKIEFEATPMGTSDDSNLENLRFFSCCSIEPPKFIRRTNQLKYEKYLRVPNAFFFSHLSLGLDAAIALDFHVRREEDPSKFTSPFKNKVLYLNETRTYFKEFVFSGSWNLSLYVRLFCDGHDLTDSIRSCHSLVILNSPGYSSGTNPWGNKADRIHKKDPESTKGKTRRFDPQNFGDQKLEVLGLTTKQMGFIQLGLKGCRIAQCNQIRLELDTPMPVQMDGEPFYIGQRGIIHIEHAGQVLVLNNERK